MERLTHEFTLERPSAVATPLRVVAAAPLPLTAAFEHRVSAAVRQHAWALAERFPSLEPIETICTLADNDGPAITRSGVVLLDRRFPVWLAMFDDMVFFSVDTELIGRETRARFEAVRRYVGHLGTQGYAVVFDHASNSRVPLTDALPTLVSGLARRGGSRGFARITEDARWGFLGGASTVFVLDAALNTMRAHPRPLWASALHGLVVGLTLAGVQRYWARAALMARLRQIREEIVTGRGPGERLVFRASRGKQRFELACAFLVACFALASYLAGVWLGVAVFGTVLVLGAMPIVFRSRAHVVLDGYGIEGHTRGGRVRVSYRDVEEIRHRAFPEMLIVRSSAHGLWVPRQLQDFEQLLDVLWDRVEHADRGDAATRDAPPPAALAMARDALARARAAGTAPGPHTLARPPLWLLVPWRRHALRGQYRSQARLLRQGQIVWAYVVWAATTLYGRPTDSDTFDMPATVLYGTDAVLAERPERLHPVALRIWGEDEVGGPDLTHPGAQEDVAAFRRALSNAAGMVLNQPVPRALADGLTLFCTTLVVVRRHVPLGQLHRAWLPILVDAPACRFAIVVPWWYWDVETRQWWKAGARQSPDDHGP